MPSCAADLERRLQSLLPGTKCYFYQSISSTIDLAKELLSDEAPQPQILVAALNQTAGRGRHPQKLWYDTPDALKITLCLPLSEKLSQVDYSAFSLVTMMVFKQILAEFPDARVQKMLIKWPNDLLRFDYRKLAGCLLQKISHRYLLISLGANLFSVPQSLSASAAPIFTEKPPQVEDQTQIMISLISKFAQQIPLALQEFCNTGFAGFYQQFAENTVASGTRLQTLDSPAQIYEYSGVDLLGRLCLINSNQEPESFHNFNSYSFIEIES